MMNKSRRDFLKLTGLAGAGLLTGGARRAAESDLLKADRQQHFNMHGYAAPALDLVRVGIVGMGGRGNGAASRLNRVEGVEIRAIADVEDSAIEAALERMRRNENYPHTPDTYSGSEDAWNGLAVREDYDQIFVSTHWNLHSPIRAYGTDESKYDDLNIPS